MEAPLGTAARKDLEGKASGKRMEREDSTGTRDSFSLAALHACGTSSLLLDLLLLHTHTHTQRQTQAVASLIHPVEVPHTQGGIPEKCSFAGSTHGVHTQRARTHGTHTQSTHNKPAHRDWLISALDKEGLLPDSRLPEPEFSRAPPLGILPSQAGTPSPRAVGRCPLLFGSVEIHLHCGIPTGSQDFPAQNLLWT